MNGVFCLWLSLVGPVSSAQHQNAGLNCRNGYFLAEVFTDTTKTTVGNNLLSTPKAAGTAGTPNPGEDASELAAAGADNLFDEPSRIHLMAEAAAYSKSVISVADSLPVVLKSFEGHTSGTDCTAQITWQTASEQGSWAYEVQTSADGQAFTTLGTVPSKNRLTGANYTFRAGALPEARYFRLKLLAVGGASTYSPVVVVDAACTASKLLIAPNPARDQATVRGLPPGRSQALLYNATGQCVARASGEGSIALPLDDLPVGVYLLKAVSEGGNQAGSAKLVKE